MSPYGAICNSHINLQLLKIRALLKIIQRKRRKYDFISDIQVIRLNYWFNLIDIEFDLLLYKLATKEEQGKIIEYYLTYKYYKCIINLQSNNIPKALCVLGMSLGLINLYLPFTRNYKILFVMQKLLMIVSKVLIQNCDYVSSFEYIRKAINIGIKIIVFQTNLNDNIEMNSTTEGKSSKAKMIGKAIKNIIQSVINRGICEEQLGYINNAIRWYKGSYWMSLNIFTFDSFLEMFTNNIILRSIEMKKLLIYLKYKNKELKEKRKLLLIQEQQMKEKKAMKNHIFYRDHKILQRFEKTEKKVLNMNIPEVKVFKSNEKNTNNKYMLSHLYLIDTYLSDEFKEFINNSKTIPIANIDFETKNQIERILHKSKLINTSNKPQNCRNRNSITISSPKQTTTTTSVSKNNTTMNRLFTRYNSSKSPCLILNKNSSQIFEYKNSYKKKRLYLNDLNSKELKFQKELLNLKHTEIENKDKIDKYQISQEADFAVKQMLIDNSLLLFNDNNNRQYTVNEIKRIKLFLSLENKTLKSLSPKVLKKYLKELNHKTKPTEHYSKIINTSSSIEKIVSNQKRMDTFLGCQVSTDLNNFALNNNIQYKGRKQSVMVGRNHSRMKSI